VAVEKVTHQKMAEKTLRYDALQTTFSIRVDIFYPPNFGCFEKNGLFQQPLAIALIIRQGPPQVGSMRIACFQQLTGDSQQLV
jgi:hypothetical protein